MNQFSKLGLSKPICDVLDELGFEQPTPIQEQAIPLILSKNPTDFIGLAQTGTGKTAAFGLPLIELIDTDVKTTQALIMAPTRELGQQIAKQLQAMGKAKRAMNIEVVYGGANIVTQIKALKSATQIVVATPGRLLDLIKRKAINLEAVRFLVLDEADEMLNMGFKEDIDKILEYTNINRSVWLFSATMPREIRNIVSKYMKNPAEVSINSKEVGNENITHQYVITKSSNRIPALRRFLDIQPDMRGVMFCRTKRETQEIADQLTNLDYNVEALHGDLSQGQRDAVMNRFKRRSMQLLIATDVAARGIDVSDLTHVIQHTLPDQLEIYTHRSGRTGRAGKKGISLVFTNSREGRRIKELENKLKISFEKVEIPGKEELISRRISHWAEVVVNLKEHEQADELLNLVSKRFEKLSKEDILKKLITSQLDHIGDQGGDDLNETQGSSSGSGRSSSGGGFVNSSNEQRFFINIGSIDGLAKGDILHMISDVAGIDRNKIGEIDLKKNCSFFYLDRNNAEGISQKFDGMEIEGRAIRVNQDDDGPPRGGGSSSRNRSKGRQRDFSRPGNRNRKRR